MRISNVSVGTMRNLYAPWRMEYIGGEPEPGCLFCRVRDEGAEKDADNLVVWRAQDAIVLLNKFPYNNGHLLVAPHEHVSSLEDLPDPAALALHHALTRSLRVLRDE